MDFALSAEQQQLKDTAREFLRNECPTTRVRQVMADEEGMARDLYGEIAKLGWSGLIVPEQFGGSGLGMLDMMVLLEEGGYAAMPGPFLFSSVLAAEALRLGGSDELKARWLPALAEGKAIGTIAIVEPNDGIGPGDLAVSARKEGKEWALSGIKMLVPYANAADFVIVSARIGADLSDVGLFLVETGAHGLRRQLLKHFDLTRRVSMVELDWVKVPASAELSGGKRLFDRLLDIGSVAIAADSLGGVQRALEMAVEYSKVREQFGKPIGSFQALKHAAAEIVSEAEPGRALVWYAAYAQDALPREASRAAAMAKARLAEVFMRGADRAVLMHGGIGFTWDHDMHIWFKRARFNESYFGSPVLHRERVAILSGY